MNTQKRWRQVLNLELLNGACNVKEMGTETSQVLRMSWPQPVGSAEVFHSRDKVPARTGGKENFKLIFHTRPDRVVCVYIQHGGSLCC